MSKQLRKILYIEDEADIRAVAKVALETIGGFETKMCESAQEALECISEYSPDLIILDVMMPNMGGVEALGEIKKLESQKDVPAIFMTAKVYEDEINHFKSQGAQDVIPKPFDPLLLAQQVQAIWNKLQD